VPPFPSRRASCAPPLGPDFGPSGPWPDFSWVHHLHPLRGVDLIVLPERAGGTILSPRAHSPPEIAPPVPSESGKWTPIREDLGMAVPRGFAVGTSRDIDRRGGSGGRARDDCGSSEDGGQAKEGTAMPRGACAAAVGGGDDGACARLGERPLQPGASLATGVMGRTSWHGLGR
jgi:hypothetical protein